MNGRYMMVKRNPALMVHGNGFALFRLFAAHSYEIQDGTMFKIGSSKVKLTFTYEN